MIIDISQEILSCQVYPGDPRPKAEKLMDMDKGDLYSLSALSMCVHNGTHIDAPAHFIKGGKTVDMLPLQAFIGPCWLAEHKGNMTGEEAAYIINRQKPQVQPGAYLSAGRQLSPHRRPEYSHRAAYRLSVWKVSPSGL